MASKFTAFFAWGLRLSDLAIVVGAGLLAYRLRFDTFEMPIDYVRSLARSVLFALLALNGSSLYRSWRGSSVTKEAFKLVTLWSMVFAAGIVYTVALQLAEDFSRLWWLTWFALTLAGTIAARVVLRSVADHLRTRGMDQRTAVIVGGGRDARRIAQGFAAQPWTGIEIKGWFSTPASHMYLDDAPLLGALDKLAEYVESNRIDQVWIALPMSAETEIQNVLRRLSHSTADIKLVPDLFGLQLLNHSVEQMAGVPVISLRSGPLHSGARVAKAIEDKVLATLILMLIAPLMLLIALGVKLTSPGPVLFRQKRHGINGREIEVLKFRSMRMHAEHGTVTQATKGDARVTPFGAFLRRTSLDELPQFFNVLTGEMSVVGPRPHAIAHNHLYRDQVDEYMQRHRVKPGITGWAQVNGFRGETDTLDKMVSRVEYDLYYLQHWSLAFDLRIVFLTIFKGFINRNAY
ncbi:MAG: undecaprenyl-phosphate glucose phosphotransferase [Luteimonas sp.]